MEQSPSWETNSHSGNQIPRLFMELEGSLRCSQQPATDPYPEPDESSPRRPIQFPLDTFQY
jgi:hypothetical protein